MEDNMECDVNTFDNPFDASVFPDLIPTYYKRFFPFALYYEWLRYDDDKLFSRREFSFTLQDDVYLRYQSFKDQDEFKKEVIQKCPFKIDIGAVYSFRPSEQRTASNFHPIEKELVFDIDMTDYDEVRTCCSGADICKKCWPFMTVALKILDRALKEDFGFKHLLWVYSGRRGIHCWVCDKVARDLSPAARSAIVEYLSVVKGGEFKAKKVYLPDNLHPSLKEAEKIVDDYFEDLMLSNQEFLDNPENCEKVISMCLDQNGKTFIKNEFEKCSSSKQKWEKLIIIDETAMNQQQGFRNKFKNFITEVKFQLCYPRLDINVSKGLNHLLKAPFCVHPKTGRVCVPIDIKNVDSFDPFNVPTISSLCKEIDEYDAALKEENVMNGENSDNITKTKVEDFSKTSLQQSIHIFRNFIKKLGLYDN